MIGVYEMMWTAIMDCDGRSAAFSFYAENDCNAALKFADSSSESDGYEIVGLLKGNHTSKFYSIDPNSREPASSD